MISALALNFPDWDKQLFIVLNNFHFSWLDPIMVGFSAHWLWAPLYLAIAFFMVRQKKWHGAIALLFVGITFALTDQLSVHLFKNVFERLRPCHESDIQAVIHQLEGCGGRYGFISNHAANTFGLAIFTSLFFKRRAYSVGIFVWAALVAYSRIYVGKHYPLDVICGAIFGVITGCIVYICYTKLLHVFILKNRAK